MEKFDLVIVPEDESPVGTALMFDLNKPLEIKPSYKSKKKDKETSQNKTETKTGATAEKKAEPNAEPEQTKTAS
ncbi:MAG TPA: hypothetical protein VNT01_14520 [Symbiobacteriaceae bacterium]|nr:hypothetical protein [Symbiobacteriaceae bacterium]